MLLEPIGAKKESLTKLYDFDLMEGGGHITGYLVSGEEAAAFEDRLTAYTAACPEKYQDLPGASLVLLWATATTPWPRPRAATKS